MARQERAVRVENVLNSAGTASIYLHTASAVYTKAFYLGDAIDVGVSYKITPDVTNVSASATLVLELGYETPEVEGSASPVFVTPVGMSASVITMTTNNWVHIPLFTASALRTVANYGRFLIQGNGWNSGSTVLVKISKQVEG